MEIQNVDPQSYYTDQTYQDCGCDGEYVPQMQGYDEGSQLQNFGLDSQQYQDQGDQYLQDQSVDAYGVTPDITISPYDQAPDYYATNMTQNDNNWHAQAPYYDTQQQYAFNNQGNQPMIQPQPQSQQAQPAAQYPAWDQQHHTMQYQPQGQQLAPTPQTMRPVQYPPAAPSAQSNLNYSGTQPHAMMRSPQSAQVPGMNPALSSPAARPGLGPVAAVYPQQQRLQTARYPPQPQPRPIYPLHAAYPPRQTF